MWWVQCSTSFPWFLDFVKNQIFFQFLNSNNLWFWVFEKFQITGGSHERTGKELTLLSTSFFTGFFAFKKNRSYLGQNQFYDFWESPSIFILRTVVEVYNYTSKIENLSIVVQTNVVWFLIWFFLFFFCFNFFSMKLQFNFENIFLDLWNLHF